MWAYSLIRPSFLQRVELPAPQAGDLAEGEVLLRTLGGGICGSDLPYFRGARPIAPIPRLGDAEPALPGYPLHEIVGEVLASRFAGIEVGQRVVGWAGGMDGLAEVVVGKGSALATYDARWAPTAAVMLQPLACVVEAVDRLGDVRGARVAVLGLGPIGILFSHVVKDAGAAEVVGVDRVDRADVAAAFGVDVAVRSGTDWWAHNLEPQAQPDIVIEAIGHQVGTLAHAVEAVAVGGQILYFGIPDDPVYPVPMAAFLRKNLRLTAGTTQERRAALHRADNYLARHPALADAYVTSRFPVRSVNEAFETAATPAAGRLKVVLDMDESATGR